MKTKTNKPGEGHKTSAIIDFAVKIEADGKTITDLQGHYEISMQFESIEYLVQNTAAAVARVAARIAEPNGTPSGVSHGRMPGPKTDTAAKVG